MTTVEVGNGSVPVVRMEALASELRLLKSAMSDMQGRLDTLLVEIGNELQPVSVESGPSIEVLELAQDVPQTQETVEIEPVMVVETAEEIAPTGAIEEPATATVETVIEADQPEIVEVAAETIETTVPTATSTDIETTDAEPVIELAADTQAAETPVEVAQIEAAAEQIALAEVSAETAVIEAQPAIAVEAVEVPAVAALPETVVPADVLVERRNARKGRSAVARVGRWAAVIALIALCAGLVATGTGFAGHGEILTVKGVCAIAGDVCSIVPGIP